MQNIASFFPMSQSNDPMSCAMHDSSSIDKPSRHTPSPVTEAPDIPVWPVCAPSFHIEGVGLVDELPFEGSAQDPTATQVDRKVFQSTGVPLPGTDSSRDLSCAAERSVASATTTGDFLCAHIHETHERTAWPVMDIPVLHAQDTVPAIPPPIDPATAAGRSDLPTARQADPKTLLSEPFADFNAVRPAERIDLTGPPPPTDCPSAGAPHTVFEESNFIHASDGGGWVRRFVKQHPKHPSVSRRGKAGKGVHWSDRELFEQTELWFASAAADMLAFERHGGAHRSSTPTFIIPDRCHRGGGRHIWDLRGFRRAQAAGEDTSQIQIPHLDVDLSISPKLRSDRLRKRFEAAGVTDEFVMQQMLESGLVSHSQAPRHTILQLNYPPVARHMRFARDLVRRESEERKLSSPFSTGIPLFPVRLNPYGAVERDGKDPRLCCDLSSPQRDDDGAGTLSINAGIPFHDTALLAQLKLTSAHAFARDTGILRAVPGGTDQVWIATADWTAYYRNLLKPVAEWWTQLLWLDPTGPQIDLATCFGDAGAPTQSNRVQDAILHLIAHEFENRLCLLRSDPECTDLLERLDSWVAAREAALRSRFPARFAAAEAGDPGAEIWVARQSRLAALHGFFDDSLLASFAATASDVHVDGQYVHTHTTGLFAALVDSLLTVADDIGLPVAAHKIACGSPDGRTGPIDLEHWRKSGQICWVLAPGAMVALGKEIDLSTSSIRDTEKRVRELAEDVEALCDSANSPESLRGGKPTVLVGGLREAVGKSMFVLQTEPHLRPGLNRPIQSLKDSSLVPVTAKHKRTRSTVFDRNLRSHKRSRTFFPEEAQADFRQMAFAIQPRSGVPFNQVVSNIGSGPRQACWILEDASGQAGGGGGAVFLDPADLSVALWAYDPFQPDELAVHSTFIEGLNANRNLLRAAEYGYTDIIEVLDNSSWVAVARSGRARDPVLQGLLQSRQDMRLSFPDVCVYSVWQPREKGTIADATSKLELQYEGAGLPSLPRSRPITGRDWANAALLEAGFVDGLAPQHRLK